MRAQEFIVEAEPTPAEQFITDVYAEYPQTFQNNHVMAFSEEEFAMFELKPSTGQRGAVELYWFQAYPLRSGVGTRAIQVLQNKAREYGVGLTLMPWDKGQVSQAALTKFYKKQGFQPTVKGGRSMIWEPTKQVTEISDQRLQDYLSRAGRQVDARQERMARVRDRLNKGYEIYHAETPNKIVHRFEANTPREAKRYYDDFITKYESDVDYDLRLRRATGLNEFAPSPERNNNDDVPDPIFVLANRWWNAADKQPQIESVLNSMGWSIHQVESEDDAVQLTHRDGTTYFISADDFDPDLFENTEDYAGMQLRLSKDSDGVAVRALAGGKELGMAEFFFDNEGRLDPQTVWVDERYHGQGIAAAMYDYLKDKGYTIIRSWDQTDAGRGFWDKHRGAEATVWEAHIPTILPGDDEEQTPPPEKSQRYAGQPRAYHVLGYNGTLMSPAMRKFLTAHVKHPKDANWSNVVVVEYDPQWYTHTFGRSNNPVLQKIHSWEDFWNLILKRYFVELQAPRKVQS